jgi:hypothetical protein
VVDEQLLALRSFGLNEDEGSSSEDTSDEAYARRHARYETNLSKLLEQQQLEPSPKKRSHKKQVQSRSSLHLCFVISLHLTGNKTTTNRKEYERGRDEIGEIVGIEETDEIGGGGEVGQSPAVKAIMPKKPMPMW